MKTIEKTKTEKIDLESLGQREFDVEQTMKLLYAQREKVWSWGIHDLTRHKEEWLRFMVNGHHHEGHVYIRLGWNDLYDVFLTTSKGTIVKEMKEIYFDELCNRIDLEVEYVESYKY